MFHSKRDAKYSDARERSGRERVRNDGSVGFFVIDLFLPVPAPILPSVVQVRSSGPYSSSHSYSKPGEQSPPKGSRPGSCKSYLRFHPSITRPVLPFSEPLARTLLLRSKNTPLTKHTQLTLVQVPLGHRGAPIGRLRDRARPERATDRTAAALRSLLVAQLGPMLVLRPHRTLARMVRRRARCHAGVLGRARSGDGIGSPRT